MITVFYLLICLFILFIKMKFDVYKFSCNLYVNLSFIIPENFKDLASLISDILAFMQLHSYKFGLVYVPVLMAEQQEADTMMLLHAQYASLQGSNTVYIFRPDTDVMVLMVHHFYSIGAPCLYFQTGRKYTHKNTQVSYCQYFYPYFL